MDTFYLIFIGASVFAIAFKLLIFPWLSTKGMNPAMLMTLTMVVDEAVRFAEQMYKVNPDDYECVGEERKMIAIQKVIDILDDMGIDGNKFYDEIDWLIEAAVNRLPKTHQ